MIIYTIDDVYDLPMGHPVKDFYTGEIVGEITKRCRRMVNILPYVSVGSGVYFRNGFEYYSCKKIKQYMIIPPTNPPFYPRLKI